MVGPRVVDPLGVGDERLEEAIQLEQAMPIAVVAGQPRGIQAHHQPGMAQPDLGDQLLEAVAFIARDAALVQVVIDDHHAVAWPSQAFSSLDERETAGRRALGADLDRQPATVAVPSRNGCARRGSECVPIVTRRRHSAPCARRRGGPRCGTACAGRRTHRRAWPSVALAHRP